MILSGKFNTIRAVVGFAQQVERGFNPFGSLKAQCSGGYITDYLYLPMNMSSPQYKPAH